MPAAISPLATVDHFLRADAQGLREWVAQPQSRLVWLCMAAIVAGGGLLLYASKKR